MTPSRIIDSVEVEVLELPTEHGPESDGTLVWDSTTMILIELRCAGGVAGIAAMAISAVDAALWDLEARLLELPLATLLGAARAAVPAYASGGFTSTGLDALAEEVAGYVEAGYRAVKIKVGRDPAHDVERVRTAREAAGAGVALMVDANVAYTRPQALALAERFAEHDVTVAAAAPQIVHLECFRDHVRFEQLVFEGAAGQHDGAIAYDRQRPGLGIAVRRREANRHAV